MMRRLAFGKTLFVLLGLLAAHLAGCGDIAPGREFAPQASENTKAPSLAATLSDPSSRYSVAPKSIMALGVGTTYGVAYSPDGTLLASASSYGVVQLWRVSDGSLIRTFSGHSSSVNAVAFSTDGTMLASGSGDKTVKLWRVSDGSLIRTFSGHTASINAVVFSLDNTTLASASSDASIKLWRVYEGDLVRTFSGHTYDVYCVAFSPDGTMLASGSGDLTVKLWRVVDGALIRTLSGHWTSVYSVAFSFDGATLASGGGDSDNTANTIKLWRVSDGGLIRSLVGHTDSVYCVRFSPNGEILASASADFSVQLWRVSDGSLIRKYSGHTGPVRGVSFSPDGATLASGGNDKSIKIWATADGATLRSLSGHTFTISSVAFSPDGTTLASGSWDNTIRFWRVSDGSTIPTPARHWNYVSFIAYSPDGTMLASASWDRTVKLWRISDGSLIRTIAVSATQMVDAVAFSPDGTLLATGSAENAVKVWKVSDGTLVSTLAGHTSGVDVVAFSPDGTLLASGSGDTTIKLWQVSDWSLRSTFSGHTSSVYSVAFSPNGTLLASGSPDKSIKLWQVSNGTLIRTIPAASGVLSVAFSPDASTIASGNQDWSVTLWRASDGSLINRLVGHTYHVWSVAFSPDGETLASGSADQSIRLWRFETCSPLATPQLDPAADQCGAPAKSFSWTSSENLTYDLIINGARVLTNLTATHATLPADFAYLEGMNSWQVAARDCGGNEALSAEGQFSYTPSPTPKAPILLEPPEGEEYSCRIPFYWGANGNPSTDILYTLYVYSESDLSTPIIVYKTNGVSADYPLPTGAYRWQVVASNCAGILASSELWPFTMNNDPFQPEIYLPAEGSWVANTPRFQWNHEYSIDDYITVIIDGQADSIPDSSINWMLPDTPLSYGEHTWQVIAKRCNRNTKESLIGTFRVDDKPPSAFDLLSPADRSGFDEQTIRFMWTPSTETEEEGIGAATCVVKIDDVTVGEVAAPGTSWESTPAALGLAEGRHDWFVLCRDAFGNGRESNTRRYFYIDRTPPSGALLKFPTNHFEACITQLVFEWQAASDENGALAGYEVWIDGAQASEFIPYQSQLWNGALPLTAGPHTWKVVSQDRAGHRTDSETFGFTIDLTPPAAPAFSAPAEDGWVNSARPLIRWDAARPRLCVAANYELTVDGLTVRLPETARSYMPSDDLREGQHTLALRMIDSGGNNGDFAIRSFSVDLTPPAAVHPVSPVSVSCPNALTTTFRWQAATDSPSGVASLTLLVDGAPLLTGIAPTATEVTLTEPLPPGAHTWQIRAVDKAGNVRENDPTDFHINSSPPSCRITRIAFKADQPDTLQVSGVAEAQHGCGLADVEVKVNDGAWQSATADSGGLSGWTYTFKPGDETDFTVTCVAKNEAGIASTAAEGKLWLATCQEPGDCDETTHECYGASANDMPCQADSDGCTRDTCQAGACVVGAAPDCSEKTDVCGTGVCQSTSAATYICIKDPTLQNGNPCDLDSDGCTLDKCQNGSCNAGATPDCSAQSDTCNTGTCHSLGSTRYECVKNPLPNEGLACSDDNVCTVSDLCVLGSCQGGAALSCEDHNICSTDICDTAKGCLHVPVADWTPCDNGACFAATCELLASNDTCEKALPIWVGDQIRASFEGAHAYRAIPALCSGQSGDLSGRDAFYRVALEGGVSYAITLGTDSPGVLALAILTSCDKGAASCRTAISKDATSGVPTLTWVEQTSGEFIIQVMDLGGLTAAATYTLEIRVLASEDGDFESEDESERENGTLDGDEVEGEGVEGERFDNEVETELEPEPDRESEDDSELPVDGDSELIAETESDGERSLDGDREIIQEEVEKEGDVEFERNEAELNGDDDIPTAGSGGGCKSSSGATALWLLLGLLGFIAGKRKYT